MFVCGGENIYPGEVEKMLERHPGIHQAAVVPVPDELKGHKPIAFVVRGTGRRARRAGGEDAMRSPTRRPTSIRAACCFVDEMPLAGTNKIDASACSPQQIATPEEKPEKQ